MSELSTQRLVLEELIARGHKPKLDFYKHAFEHQIALITSPAKLKVVHCPRRSAKSYSAALKLVITAYEVAGTKSLFLTISNDSARNILWEMLHTLDIDFQLGLDFNETRLEAKLPNRSTIRLMGIDADENQQRKVLGGKYKFIAIDEAAFFTINLREMVYKTLMPATADQDGEIWIMSTSSDITRGLFFELTFNPATKHSYSHMDVIEGFELHKWTWKDNPHTCKEVQALIDRLIEANPLISETPHFRQHYLNEWAIDADKLVYRFDSFKNTGTPPQRKSAYSYILGVDLGANDDSAFTVCAYNPHDPVLYIVETFKKPGMDFTDVANKIHELNLTYDFEYTVVDGANKQGVMEMNNRHGTNLVAADKRGKYEYIQLLNADLIMGVLKVNPVTCGALVDEWAALIWSDKPKPDGTKVESPALPNHLCDSTLYAWRHCYTYLARPEKVTPQAGSAAEEAAELDRIEARIEDKRHDKHDAWNEEIFEWIP